MRTTTALLAFGFAAIAALAFAPSATALAECVGSACVTYYGVPPGTECHANVYGIWAGSVRADCNPNSHTTCALYVNLVVRSSFACLDDAPTNGCTVGFWVMDGVPVYVC